MYKIISVVGARPNFMKVAPIHRAFLEHRDTFTHLICHTGQHYDANMSKVFFEDLELPVPDYYLGVGSGSHAVQTANVMIQFEQVLLKEQPDMILVVGDVNSTIACALTAAKLGIKTSHVEAGLRSFDRAMPEEINRVLTDSIADYLFVTEKSGLENLHREGVSSDKVFFSGNCMIDSVVRYLPKAEQSEILLQYKLSPKQYILITLHRPSNVDNPAKLGELINFLNTVAAKRKVIFPIHPRTKRNMADSNLLETLHPDITLIDPAGYLDFLNLIKNAEAIVTDSGGIQEESTYLGIPCLTLRKNTERPVTIEVGTNQLMGDDFPRALEALNEILQGKVKAGSIPELWDGHAAERIVEKLKELL
ncbi:MAG: UDP-N-acetylglucosamine 2-epimerase (non-hydrolyzing) [Ignavibacteria bacterium]|nr:UDP-N-acetylglucosamine 2-epimerase (non-hydrolyzing) [Ignavibacteria bacterium]